MTTEIALNTLEKLKGHVPDKVLSEIVTVVNVFNIDTSIKLAHLLAQCAHVSNGFIISETPNSTERYRGRGYIRLYWRENYIGFNAFVNGAITALTACDRLNTVDYPLFKDFNPKQDDFENNPELIAVKYPLLVSAYAFSKANAWDHTMGPDIEYINEVTKHLYGNVSGTNNIYALWWHYFNVLTAN